MNILMMMMMMMMNDDDDHHSRHIWIWDCRDTRVVDDRNVPLVQVQVILDLGELLAWNQPINQPIFLSTNQWLIEPINQWVVQVQVILDLGELLAWDQSINQLINDRKRLRSIKLSIYLYIYQSTYLSINQWINESTGTGSGPIGSWWTSSLGSIIQSINQLREEAQVILDLSKLLALIISR